MILFLNDFIQEKVSWGLKFIAKFEISIKKILEFLKYFGS